MISKKNFNCTKFYIKNKTNRKIITKIIKNLKIKYFKKIMKIKQKKILLQIYNKKNYFYNHKSNKKYF